MILFLLQSQETKQRYQIQNERQDLLKQLPARTKSDNVVLIPEQVLSDWITSESQQYMVPSSLLDFTHFMCPHG